MSQLVTGEAIVLDLRTAGVPSRLVAAALDALVQFVLWFVLLFLVGVVVAGTSSAAAAALVIVAYVVAGLGYPVLMETLTHGRTLGKLAMGLRVVRDDGGPIGFRQAITRGLLGFFVEKPGVTLGAAGLFCALLNERSKRLGDLLAGTVVIQERVATPRLGAVFMPPQLAGWATMLDLTRLSDDLAESARSFLSRFATLTPAAQADLGGRLADAVAAVVTPAPPPGVPAWAYLSAVLAERRRRATPPPAGYAPGWPPAATPAPPVAPAPPRGPFAPPG